MLAFDNLIEYFVFFITVETGIEPAKAINPERFQGVVLGQPDLYYDFLLNVEELKNINPQRVSKSRRFTLRWRLAS